MLASALDLDPSDPRDEAAIVELLERGGNAVGEEFARRVAADGASDSLRAQGLLAAACIVQRRSDGTDADALFSDGLHRLWGSGTLGEFRGCVNYALLCLTRRRVFEALVLARRACDLARDLEHALGAAIAQGHLVGVLMEMRDWSRAEACLTEMETLVADVPAEQRDPIDRRAVSYRLELAFHRDDGPGALRALERLQALPPVPDPRATPWCRALTHACNGRHADALQEIARVRHPNPDRYEFEFGLLEVACLVRAAPADAIVTATRLIERLRGGRAAHLSSGRRLTLAEQLGRLMLHDLPAREVATVAFGVAGAAALERMGELDRFLRELPELHENYIVDYEVVGDYRARFTTEHHELLDVIADLLGEAPRRSPTFGRVDSAGTICVCAWCRRVRGPDGMWLDLGSLRVPEGALQATHGACRDCRDRVLGRLRSPVAGPTRA